MGKLIDDLVTGKKLHRVEVTGFQTGPVQLHGCPSHGVGLTPDESEVWVVDDFNKQVHAFDNTKDPPQQLASIPMRFPPGWITFTLDGKQAIVSSGEIVDVATKKVVFELATDKDQKVLSEKVVEIHWENGKISATGDQFGVGRVVAAKQ